MLPSTPLSESLDRARHLLLGDSGPVLDASTLPVLSIEEAGLVLQRVACHSDARFIAAALRAFKSECTRRNDPQLEALLLQHILDAGLSPTASLEILHPAGPRAHWTFLHEEWPDAWEQWEEILTAHMRQGVGLAFPVPMLQEIAGRLSKQQSPDGRLSVSERMRESRRLADGIAALTGNTQPAALKTILEEFSSEHVEHNFLSVALAHYYPLCSRRNYGEDVGMLCVANLYHWRKELDEKKARWLREWSALRQLPDMRLSDLPDLALRRYSIFFGEVLRGMRESDRIEFPEPVHWERAFCDLLEAVTSRAFSEWRHYPSVLVGLTQLVSESPTIRLFGPAVLEELLIRTPSLAEGTQNAAIEFARSFLTGYTAEEIRLQMETLHGERGDARWDRLQQQIRTAQEADTRTRQILEDVAFDQARQASVRIGAIKLLFSCCPSAAEAQRLAEKATVADDPVVQGFLEYVVAYGVQSRYRQLVRLAQRASGLSARSRTLYAAAQTKTAHPELPSLLQPDILKRDQLAEKMLRDAGGAGVLDQIIAERTICDNVRRIEELNRRRQQHAEAAHAARIAHIRAQQEYELASVEDLHLAAVAKDTQLSLRIQEVGFELQRYPLRIRLERLMSEIPRLEGIWLDLTKRISELGAQISGLTRTIDGFFGEIRAAEQRIADLENNHATLTVQLQKAQQASVQADRDLAVAHQHLAALYNQRNRLGAGDMEGHVNLSRKIRQAEELVIVQRRDIEYWGTVLPGISGQIERNLSDTSTLRALASARESDVQSLRQRLAMCDQLRHQASGQRQSIGFERDQRMAAHAGIAEELSRIRQAQEAATGEVSRRLADLQHRRQGYAKRMERSSGEAQRTLAAYDASRLAVEQCTAEIAGVDQRNAELKQSLAANRDSAARQWATIAGNVAHTEAQWQQQTRETNLLKLNLDVQFISAQALAGSAREAAELLRKVEAI